MNIIDMQTGKPVLERPEFEAILDGWLAEWYEASVLGRHKTDETIKRFKRIAALQPKLQQEAVRRLESIKDIPDERCFITKTNRNFLKRVTT